MDENSCEDETSESAENVLEGRRTDKMDDVSHLENAGVRIDSEAGNVPNQVSGRCGSSVDASASEPPCQSTLPEPQDCEQISEAPKEEEIVEAITESVPLVEATEEDASPANTLVPDTLVRQGSQQMSTCAEEQPEPTVIIGPPPSYSFVMKQKKLSSKAVVLDIVNDRPPPPPTYSGNRGLCLPPEDIRQERVCNLPSLPEPLWRSHSQPALCPRCGIIIQTSIHTHYSVATHAAALALCLFGCWPCCLLPYCLNTCKNTYHHCPICHTFLGVYSPW